jgi:hypothetical protein
MNKMYMLYLLLLVIILIFIKIYTHQNKKNKLAKLENFVNNSKILEKKSNQNKSLYKESYYCGIVPSNTNDNDEYLINQPDYLINLKKNKYEVKPINHLYYFKQANLKLKPFIKKKENTVPLRPQKYRKMIIRDFDQDIRKIK